jgi:hypothetical protein
MKACDIVAEADPRVGQVYEFWKAARGANQCPAQMDLDLFQISKLLPNVFIIDVLGGSQFRYRYLGTKIDEHLGRSFTGKVFSQARSGRVLSEITRFFDRIAEDRVLGLLETRLPSERLEWVRYSRLGLPIADDHRTVSKIFGLFLFEGIEDRYFRTPDIHDINHDELGEVASRFGDLD